MQEITELVLEINASKQRLALWLSCQQRERRKLERLLALFEAVVAEPPSEFSKPRHGILRELRGSPAGDCTDAEPGMVEALGR